MAVFDSRQYTFIVLKTLLGHMPIVINKQGFLSKSVDFFNVVSLGKQNSHTENTSVDMCTLDRTQIEAENESLLAKSYTLNFDTFGIGPTIFIFILYL